MTRSPWMKWYPSDWRGDSKLRRCSPIARYVWLEMLGLMHEADEYGHLEAAGKALDNTMLSILIGVSTAETRLAVRELERNGVFSRTDAGVIFSRRMVRDKMRANKAREHGAKGGNPSLQNQRLRPCRVKGRDKGGVIPHIPDTRKEYEHERLSSFPRDGSIGFTPWAEIARKAGRNIDVDILANAFRGWCASRGMGLDEGGIGKAFLSFCQRHRIVA